MRWLIAIALLCVACDDDPAPALIAPDGELPCTVPCRSGFTCQDGTCVPACNPACPVGLVCSNGQCEPARNQEDLLDVNVCGGTGPLAGQPGETCGPCQTGFYLCIADNDVACIDPGANACGGCNTLPGLPNQRCEGGVWRCTPEGDLLCVSQTTDNLCGGVLDLAGQPGRPCGACNEGIWQCDGRNDVICVGALDSACDCATGPEAVECGTDAGRCRRGIRVCQADGSYSACVVAPAGAPCTTSCGPNSFCVAEQIGFAESIGDDCRPEDGVCSRRVCRTLNGTRACTTDTDCAESQGCVRGFCFYLVTTPDREYCNGIDDNCDGRIDDDVDRVNICGLCPHNMVVGVLEGELFCISRYEASRPDASMTNGGESESHAVSQPDVLPWTAVTASTARAACNGTAYNREVPGGIAERRLCLAREWWHACSDRAYPYGNAHMPGACNDDDSSIATTGSHEACAYPFPPGGFLLFDMVGNAAEWARWTVEVKLMGGSFLTDGATCNRLEAPEVVTSSQAIGFRCCDEVDKEAIDPF